jgi:hypothetical protein
VALKYLIPFLCSGTVRLKEKNIMSYDLNNIFARILRQEIPCNKVYEDENFIFQKII